MVENLSLVLAILLGISEALSLIPGINANGIFQLVLGLLKKLNPKKVD